MNSPMWISLLPEGVLGRMGAWLRAVVPVAVLVAMLFTAVGAYQAFLTPFSPSVTASPLIWRLGPGTPSQPFMLSLWLTLTNRGARDGSVDDLAAIVSFPRGEWLLVPRLTLRPGDYYQALHGGKAEPAPVEGPFAPMFLPGRTQVTKVVLFDAMAGKFDPSLAEPGDHMLRVFARYQRGGFTPILTERLMLGKAEVDRWRAGGQIGGVIHHAIRPRPEMLLEELGR